MTAEVPVWISGTQKWVTGVTRKTTCEDVVRALLKAEEVRLQQNPGAVPDPLLFSPPSSSLSPSSAAASAAAAAAPPTAPFVAVDARHFAVVERWRKMERPLDSGSRILKAWNAWGDQKYEIKFSLKRVEPLTPRTVKTSSHRHRRPSHAGGGGGASGSRRHWRHAGSPPRSEEHPRKFSKSAEQNIETLMKMILAQGETIRAQLGRLKDREDDIAYFETRFSDDDDGDGDRRKTASAILSKGSPNKNKISVAPGPTCKTGVNSNSSNNNNNNGEEAGSNDSGIVEDSTLIAKNKKLQRRASVASRHEIVRVDVHEAPAGRTTRGSSADRDRDRDDGFVDSTIRSSNLAAMGKNKLMTASSSALFSRGDVPSSSSSSSAASSPTTAGNANNKSSSSSYRSTRGSDPNLPSRDVEPGRDRRFRPTTERDVQQPPPSSSSSSSGNNRAIRSHSLYCPQQSRQLPQAKPEAPTTRRLPTLPGQQQQQDRDVRRLPRPTAGVDRDDDDDDDYQQQQQQQQAAGVQQHPSPAKNRAERLRNAARSRAATTSQRIPDGDGDGGAAACPGELPQTRPISSTTTTDAEIDNCVRIYEQVLDLCLRLEEEEERINRLTAKIQRENARQSGSSSGGDEDDADYDDYADGDGDGGRRHHDAERLLAESERELRHMRRLSDNLNSEIERNDRTMADMSLVLRDKQVYLDQLQFQLMQAERDSDYLQDALDNFVLASPQPSPPSSSSSSSSKPTPEAGSPGCRPQPPPSAPKGILKNKTNAAPAAQVITTTPGRQRHASHQQQQGRTLAGGKDGVASTGPVNGAGPQRDADSDTGLSSLHSSSDEAQYALDTLV